MRPLTRTPGTTTTSVEAQAAGRRPCSGRRAARRPARRCDAAAATSTSVARTAPIVRPTRAGSPGTGRSVAKRTGGTSTGGTPVGTRGQRPPRVRPAQEARAGGAGRSPRGRRRRRRGPRRARRRAADCGRRDGHRGGARRAACGGPPRPGAAAPARRDTGPAAAAAGGTARASRRHSSISSAKATAASNGAKASGPSAAARARRHGGRARPAAWRRVPGQRRLLADGRVAARPRTGSPARARRAAARHRLQAQQRRGVRVVRAPPGRLRARPRAATARSRRRRAGRRCPWAQRARPPAARRASYTRPRQRLGAQRGGEPGQVGGRIGRDAAAVGRAERPAACAAWRGSRRARTGRVSSGSTTESRISRSTALGMGPGVVERQLRAVGDAEQRQSPHAERAPDRLHVLDGVGRRVEGAPGAEPRGAARRPPRWSARARRAASRGSG